LNDNAVALAGVCFAGYSEVQQTTNRVWKLEMTSAILRKVEFRDIGLVDLGDAEYFYEKPNQSKHA